MTRLTGGAPRVTVLIGEHDTWHHRPLHSEIVHRARVSVFRGPVILDGCEVVRDAGRTEGKPDEADKRGKSSL